MPNGRTHAVATALAAGLVSPIVSLMGHQPAAHAFAFAGGCLIGLVINPDLDVRHTTHSHEVIERTVGTVIAEAWRMAWWPYSRLIPRHRHPLSHFPIIGTALRLVYLWLVAFCAWTVAGLFINLPPFSVPYQNPITWWMIGGLVFSDTLHTVMDYTWRW